MKRSRRADAIRNGWRSGLEEDVAASLASRNVTYLYEAERMEWMEPATVHLYTPDFVVTTRSGARMYIETKGRWTVADRKKMKYVVAQHPDKDIRLVFQNPNAKIAKGSKTTYAAWCDKHLGVPWAAKDVPDSWLEE